jgi:tRNA (uracil-5-)-methyltransferase TRM9
MTNKGIQEIINLNKDFYTKHNESFDKSRSYGFWEGFIDLLEVIPQNLKILDLGCGNARFLKFLLDEDIEIKNYLGVDNSDDFILKNIQKYPNYNFQVLDIISDLERLDDKYSLITAFGVTHHIPNKEFRKSWFQKIEELTIKGGFIVLSFWNFDKNKNDKNFIPANYVTQNGDYFLGWKEDYSSHRYCHFFEEEEVKEIIQIFKDCTLIKKYDKDQNTYLIIQKNS